MEKQPSNVEYRGIGALTLLGLIFITLKLTGYITWSWWWVTAPIWGQFVLVALFIFVIIIVASHRSRRF